MDLKFKTSVEITDFKNYSMSQYFNLAAFILGTFSLLLGNLLFIPFLIVIGLDLTLARYLMKKQDLDLLDNIRLGVIIFTGIITFLL